VKDTEWFEPLRQGRRSEVKAGNGRRAMEAIQYLSSPMATGDALERLKYWRGRPTLSDGIKAGNELATSDGDWNKFKGFLKMDQELTKANIELMLLKRLNYISLWTTVKQLMGEGGDDKHALRTAKVKLINEGDQEATGKQWEHTFRAAKRWFEVAERFGDGFVFYLPTQSEVFTSTWYHPMRRPADGRFAKLRDHEFSWWMGTLETILPDARRRLEMFEEITGSLKRSGDLCDISLTAIESDERWVTKKKSILTHSFDRPAEQPTVGKKKNPPTVGKKKTSLAIGKKKNSLTVGEKESPKKRRRLGMLAGPMTKGT